MGVVLEGLLKSAVPALTSAIGGPAFTAMSGIAGGALFATDAQKKSSARTEKNRGLAFENRERQRLIGEQGAELKSEASTRAAGGNIREGVYGASVDVFVKQKKDEVQKETHKAWQKPDKNKGKKGILAMLGMTAAVIGGIYAGKSLGIGGINPSASKAGTGIFGG